MRRKRINKALKSLTLTFIFLGILLISHSQVENELPEINRLEEQLGSATLSEKVEILNQLAIKYLFVNADTSKSHALNALELARILNNKNAELQALMILAKADLELYNYEDAIESYLLALDISNEKQSDSLSSDIHYSLGSVYYAQSDHFNAKKHLFQAIEYEQKLDHPLLLAHRYYHLGDIFLITGEYDDALVYFIKALGIYQEEKEFQSMADTYNSIGVVYYNLGVYEKALEQYLKSLNLFEDIENKVGMANSLNNLGLVYYDWGNKEKALQYYQKSLRIEEENANLSGMAGSFNNIGIIYADWDQHDIAIDYYRKAMDIYESDRISRYLRARMNNIEGKVILGWGIIKRHWTTFWNLLR
ncbi:MAG: tetratricopeptide repeat protein [Bacteroidales bacterium]